jgi:hypothetical protein
MQQCAQVLCDQCLLQHAIHTDHHLAICLNTQALNYFEEFTGYIQQVMMRWMEAVQGDGFEAVFDLI